MHLKLLLFGDIREKARFMVGFKWIRLFMFHSCSHGAGMEWPEQPRTECDGEGLWVAYALLGAMGISKHAFTGNINTDRGLSGQFGL